MIKRLPFPYLVLILILSFALCWLAIDDAFEKLYQINNITTYQIKPLEQQQVRIENLRVPSGNSVGITGRKFNNASELISEYSSMIQAKGGEIRNLITNTNPVPLPGTYTSINIEYQIPYKAFLQLLTDISTSALFIRNDKIVITASKGDRVVVEESVHLAWFPEMEK